MNNESSIPRMAHPTLKMAFKYSKMSRLSYFNMTKLNIPLHLQELRNYNSYMSKVKLKYLAKTLYLANKVLLRINIFFLSFLINPEVIPGRMTMLVTLFLVLINIHNTIQTNSPKVSF